MFGLVLAVSLAANFVANDKPLLVEYRGHFYAPVVERVAGTVFGAGFLPTEADYADPAVQAAIHAQGWEVWPPVRFNAASIVWNVDAPSPPSAQNFLGTDADARDVLARVIYGLRVSILFGFSLTAAASVIGILAGAVQGFYGGWVDLLGQRFIEVWSGLPQLFLLIVLASLITPGFFTLLLFLLLFSWTALTGMVRAEFLRARRLDYVRAARALGVGDVRIMARHILPNAAIAVVTFVPFLLADSIVLLASLDFLGVGLPPGAASLGELVAEAKDHPEAPWLGMTAFVVLGGVLLLLVFIGEAVREAFDPRKGL